MSRRLHLVVLPANESDPWWTNLAVEGSYGNDFAWNADFSAYRCLPHRWAPGSDDSYASYQTRDSGEL